MTKLRENKAIALLGKNAINGIKGFDTKGE